jgi:hypothetical protein
MSSSLNAISSPLVLEPAPLVARSRKRTVAKGDSMSQLNSASRTREHLTPDEVERMIAAAHQAGGRVAERDALLIMMAFRQGLRVSELAGLRWDQIDLKAGVLHVARRKNGSPSTHPLRGPELRALVQLDRINERAQVSALDFHEHEAENQQNGSIGISGGSRESCAKPAWPVERTGFEPSRPFDSAVVNRGLNPCGNELAALFGSGRVIRSRQHALR